MLVLEERAPGPRRRRREAEGPGGRNQAGPSDQAWIELGASMDAVDRMREAGERKGMVAELNRQRDLVRHQRGSAIARREASELINTHSKVADRVGCRKSANRNPIAENRLRPRPGRLAGCLMPCTSSSLLPPAGCTAAKRIESTISVRRIESSANNWPAGRCA